ncbi:MAG: hypothetical protein UW80_C0002G0018 [Microgenomates group bacterium GW2011_GWC1_44_9]|nr:MAG: hypothetical protein UW80_C0002G0018 [Microgenomates group bacterium GW2011_GWC1_44_9]
MLRKRSRILSAKPYNKLSRRLRNLILSAKNLITGVFPVFILLFTIFLVYNLFVINKIECTLGSESCPQEIMEKLLKYRASNILLLNQKKLSSSIQSSYPVEKVNIGFKIFNTLKIKLEGGSASAHAQVSLVNSLPSLELDSILGSTESSSWKKPTEEISAFIQTVNFISFELWSNGQMTPTASNESKLKLLFTSKPEIEILKSLYSLTALIDKYLDIEEILILDRRVFLRQSNQPDIIINIPFDEDTLAQALQSYAYLTTIKKDTKVIDLRFKNPILR